MFRSTVRTPLRIVAAVSALAVAAAACGGGDGTSTSSTSTLAAPSTTTPGPGGTTTRSNASITIDVPEEIVAGSTFEVSWTGPDNDRDYITIVPVGTPEGEFGEYFYTNEGSSGDLNAPIELGTYEIRYVDGASDGTLEKVDVVVVAFLVTLDFAEQTTAGSWFEVDWTGPDGAGDYVTVVPVGAPEAYYESYFDTADGPTGRLVAAADAGTYEVRYVSGANSETLYFENITVTEFEITLQAPAEVEAGAEFEVSWTGPDGPGDYITIVLADAAAGTYGDWDYTAIGNPVTLTAPDVKGVYQLRYQADRVPNRVFYSITITVK